ncbi:DUF6301 family protein [Spirillospora sp. CA-255316]
MNEWAVAGEQVADLATRLSEFDWSWAARDLPDTADVFGWQIDHRVEGVTEITSQYSDGVGTALIDVKGMVEIISLPISRFFDREVAEERVQLHDAFAYTANFVIDSMGPPTRRVPGVSPEVRWRGPDATVMVTHNTVRVTLVWVLNSYQDEGDFMESLND